VPKYFGTVWIDEHYVTNETNIDIKEKWKWPYEDSKLNGK
jgi:hypothetical protein